MRVEVDVTQEDIDNGIPMSADCCPVALALERAVGFAVEVDGAQWNRRTISEREWLAYQEGEKTGHPLPSSARSFIHEFDDQQIVTPFKFIVEVNG